MSAIAMSPTMLPSVSFRLPVLPWATAADDERRFNRILRRILAVVLLLGLIVPFVPIHQIERAELQPLPPATARLLLERPVTPPPPPKPPEKPDSATEAIKPDAPPDKPPGEIALDNARKKASGVGLLAMKNELAEMTGAPVAVQLRQDIKPGPGVGTGTGVGVGAGTEQGLPVRSMITSNATRGSGGINTAAYSRDTGGGGLAGRATTLVEGVAGGGGGGGPGGGGSRAGGGGSGPGGGSAGGAVQRGVSGKAARSIEDIKLVFERNKGAIYALYNRALRDEPGLQGKVVLEIKIAPSGQVTELRILSSELKAPELESKLLARIRQFDFGAKDVDVMIVSWPLDFLPS